MKINKDNIETCQTEDDRIQNQFTAYLCKTIHGTRQRFLMQRHNNVQSWEEFDDSLFERGELCSSSLFAESMEDKVPVTDKNLEDMISSNALLLGILKLSERERKVLYLHTICHLKHREIADFLGLKEPTVKQCYSNLIRKLKASLEVE